MVVLNKIYTRTGDAGDTALGDGTRVAKHSARVAAYGTVDECNATVGMARLHAEGELDGRLAAIQNDLFDLGADLCRPRPRRLQRMHQLGGDRRRRQLEPIGLALPVEPLQQAALILGRAG